MTQSFKTIDLNLLRVFDAIMEERSVLRAGQRVFISQSAVSHSLARLREMLGDELFVRTSAGMQPTARSLEMAPLVRVALQTLEAAIEPPGFKPSASTKRFTLAANDFTTLVVMPTVYETVSRDAPMVDIVVKPVTRIDLAEQLDLGRIDIAVGTFSGIPQRFRSRFLFEYDDVLIAGPKKDLGTLSTSKLAGLSLAVVSFGSGRDGAVDGFISERGLARRSEMYDRSAMDSALAGLERIPRIAFTLPHFLALPALVENSDLAAIVPRPLAQAFLRSGSVSMHELPYPTARMEVRLLWHERHEADASQEWLREMLRKSTDQLRVTSPATGSMTTVS